MLREALVNFVVSVLLIAMLNTSSTMSGFVGEGSVMLTCEVSGFASFSGTPSWTGSGRDLTTDGSKYIINVTSGSGSLIFSNGSTGPSVISTLTINKLRMEDDGVYTCSVAGMSSTGMSSTTRLTIMQGTSPPTTPVFLATMVTDETEKGETESTNHAQDRPTISALRDYLPIDLF